MKLVDALARLSSTTPARRGLASLGVVTAGFILLCLVVLLQAHRDATASADMQARNIAAAVSQDVARNLEIYDLSLQATVQAMQIPGVMRLDPELRRMVLFPRAARASYFYFVEVLDATGSVIADSDYPTPLVRNYGGTDYFRAQRDDARDELFIGAPFRTQTDPLPTISISRRLSNPDGSFAGVVVGSMRLAYFRDLFLRLGLGPHGSIALLRRDGMVLVRVPFNADDVGRTLSADAPFFSNPNGGLVDAVDPGDHLRRRFLIQPVGNLPLVLQVGLAEIDIYAAWRNKALVVGAVVGALSVIDLCLLLVLGYAVGRREQAEAALRSGHAQLEVLAEDRQKALDAMAQTAKAKTRFLATMSHELRTPLNSILGYAELLGVDGALAPIQAAQLAAMRSAGEQLRDVINRVLDFSRVEADDRPLQVQRTGLATLLSRCREIVEPSAATKGLKLTTSIGPDVPPYVMADEMAIREVAINLLGNAVKFTDSGEVALTISRGAAGIRFVVTDTGIGIPPAQREHLFRPYERLDADRLGIAGTGLGLAIVRDLVERMGGRIEHAANPGGGSVFWFELPLPAAPATDEPVAAVPAIDGSVAAAPAMPPSRSLRVLVADDSALNRDVAASFLRRAGHFVAEAEDGEAAVCHVAAEDFDAVLMDMRMPHLDGMEATCRIRALPGPRARTPVIALTAQVTEDGGAALQAAGFQGVLLKPIDRKGLLAAIEAVVDAGAVPARAQPPSGRPPQSPDLAAQFADTADNSMDRHLAAFADEVAQLLASLDAPSPGLAVSDLAHRITGDAALLGYTPLAIAARQFGTALAAQQPGLPAMTAALRRAAAEALNAIGQRNDLIRRAAITSAKLT